MNRATVDFSHLQNGPSHGPAALGLNTTSGQQRRHKSRRAGEGTKAVIFDMGGVLVPSPVNIFRGLFGFFLKRKKLKFREVGNLNIE